MILEGGTELYRYSLEDMPTQWSTQYHSPEYFYEGYGYKNQIGAFFFYRNEITARNVLGMAIQNESQKGRIHHHPIITSCQTSSDIRLLDLTECDRPVNILHLLNDEGINVLTMEFVRHLNGTQTFDTIEDSFRFIIENRGVSDMTIVRGIMNNAAIIDDFFQWRVGYTGQLLTDFENGIPFRRLLQERGYEGYQFMEEKTSPTICIFSCEKLSKPVHNNM